MLLLLETMSQSLERHFSVVMTSLLIAQLRYANNSNYKNDSMIRKVCVLRAKLATCS